MTNDLTPQRATPAPARSPEPPPPPRRRARDRARLVEQVRALQVRAGRGPRAAGVRSRMAF